MKIKNLSIITVSFCLYFLLDYRYFNALKMYLNEHFNSLGLSHNITYFILGIPLFIGVLILGKSRNFFKNLGLNASPLKALIFSLACTAPMFIGFSILFPFNKNLSLNEFLIAAVAAAFFEELYFRGYVFGITFKFSHLGFFISVMGGSLLFASLHLYQSQDLNTLLGVFLVTFLGALIFSWVYIEWNFNLWIPVGLHFFMNLSWMMFSVSDNALGDLVANMYRGITVLLIMGLTIAYKKINKLDFLITKENVWLHNIKR